MAATIESPVVRRRGTRLAAVARSLQSRRALGIAFVALHLAFLAWLFPLMVSGGVEGDLPLYREWAMGALNAGIWPGIDTNWVYPVGALVPIVLPAVFGPAAYQLTWFLLLTVANGISLWVLTDGGRRRSAYPAAWWWLAMLFLLSPVALLRLESFTSPLVIIALVLLASRPVLSGMLLTAAAWIKVWPAAIILAAVIASVRRRSIALAAALSSLAIVAAAVTAGGLWHVTSFLGMQGSRGLQLEAPLSTPWVWMAVAHLPGAEIYQNWALETREVSGPGDTWIIENSTGLMLAAVVVIGVVIVWARWRTTDAADGGHRLVLTGALALATAFVVFNKVGSPQYMLWLAPIAVVGIATRGRGWRTPGDPARGHRDRHDPRLPDLLPGADRRESVGRVRAGCAQRAARRVPGVDAARAVAHRRGCHAGAGSGCDSSSGPGGRGGYTQATRTTEMIMSRNHEISFDGDTGCQPSSWSG